MKNTILLVILFFLSTGLTTFSQTVEQKQTGTNKSAGSKNNPGIEKFILSKFFKGETIESTKKINISKNYNEVRFLLSGQVKSGRIIITLIKPNGEKLKTIEIDVASNVTYNQEFNLKDSPDYEGDWQIKIQTEKAEGNYSFIVDTFND